MEFYFWLSESAHGPQGQSLQGEPELEPQPRPSCPGRFQGAKQCGEVPHHHYKGPAELIQQVSQLLPKP